MANICSVILWKWQRRTNQNPSTAPSATRPAKKRSDTKIRWAGYGSVGTVRSAVQIFGSGMGMNRTGRSESGDGIKLRSVLLLTNAETCESLSPFINRQEGQNSWAECEGTYL